MSRSFHTHFWMRLAEQYKEKPDVCNGIGAHHEEIEMTSIISPLVMIGDAFQEHAWSTHVKSSVLHQETQGNGGLHRLPWSQQRATPIQAGRELRVIVGQRR